MPPTEPAPSIDTGDTVLHRPTGEQWIVAYVNGDRLSACGWPDTIVPLADCELVHKARPGQRMDILQMMATSTGHRADYAREVLAALDPDDFPLPPACPLRDGDEPCEACQ